MTPDLQIPIPREELARHERYLTTYRSGTEILSEGKSDDFSLYLLRVGSLSPRWLVNVPVVNNPTDAGNLVPQPSFD